MVAKELEVAIKICNGILHVHALSFGIELRCDFRVQ